MNAENLRVPPGRAISLSDYDPAATAPFENKDEARKQLASDVERLDDLQDVFYAAGSHAMLIVLQGMDTAGKDSTIKHVFSGVNPEGIDVYAFKAPTDEEVRHDYLWRCSLVLPERGRIAVFNRSYYEEVVVVRVHEDLLAREAVAPKHGLWAERFEDINAFERRLTRNGTVILKFFLNLSKREQRKRLRERLDDPDKHWKFESGDLHERLYWERYQSAYEGALGATSTQAAPWYIIPADHKWFARTAIANIIAERLAGLGLSYPRPAEDTAAAIEAFRKQLDAE